MRLPRKGTRVAARGAQQTGLFCAFSRLKMPNRILREGILTSDRIESLDAPSEVFYRRLMSKVDDHGLYDARPSILRSSLYPLRIDRVREADIARWIAACEKAGVIALYQHDGKPYLRMLDTRWQARSEAKYPMPSANTCAQVQATAPVFVGVVGVGVVDVKTPPPPANGGGRFAEFWNLWPSHPRKVARRQCGQKWLSRRCDDNADEVLASLRSWIASEAWVTNAGEFIPAPLVWLNQERWESAPSAVLSAVVTVPSREADETQRYLKADREQREAVERDRLARLARKATA